VRDDGHVLLATAVAVLHGAVVALMVTGGLLGLRRPALLRVHAPVALAVLAVNLAGLACPLTELEQALRAAAGEARYAGGFLEHYVLQPLGLRQSAAGVQLGIYAVAVLPNALAYGLLARRRVLRPA
jgi:hypothetical protein